jgi:hypothetical protein
VCVFCVFRVRVCVCVCVCVCVFRVFCVSLSVFMSVSVCLCVRACVRVDVCAVCVWACIDYGEVKDSVIFSFSLYFISDYMGKKKEKRSVLYYSYLYQTMAKTLAGAYCKTMRR